MRKKLQEVIETLSEVPGMIGSDSPACHRVKVALKKLEAMEAAAAKAEEKEPGKE